MQAQGIESDGSNIANNASSPANPGDTKIYTCYALKEGTYFAQITTATMTHLTSNIGFIAKAKGTALAGMNGRATIDAVFTDGSAKVSITTGVFVNEMPPYTWKIEGLSPQPFAVIPILNIFDGGNIAHSDLNAIITGPGQGTFNVNQEPNNAVYPNRIDPFREFTVIFHDEIKACGYFPPDITTQSLCTHCKASGAASAQKSSLIG